MSKKQPAPGKRPTPPRLRPPPLPSKRQRLESTTPSTHSHESHASDEEHEAEIDSDTTVSEEEEYAPRSPDSQHSSPAHSLSSSSSSLSSSSSNRTWKDKTPFTPKQQVFKASLPIFRHGNIRQLTPVEPKTELELARLTFHDWLDYYLRLPDNKRSRNLFTDQQYIDLLHQCTGSQSVAEQMRERSQADKAWLYNQLKAGTYRRVQQSYTMSTDQTDTGPVLVIFVIPGGGKKEGFKRRHPTQRDALTLGMMRRCVPVS